MGSRAGNRPGPRSPQAAPGAAEVAAGETHAAPGAAMPTRRRPCQLQSRSAQRCGGGEGKRGASVRPAPGGPRAPPARRPGRSSRRAGGTIEPAAPPPPRPERPLARLPQCTAQWPDRRHYRGLSGPGGARARPGPQRGARSAVSAGKGPLGRWGAGRESVSLLPRDRHPEQWRPSSRAPQRGRPHPRPGPPSASAWALIGPRVTKTLPGPDTWVWGT